MDLRGAYINDGPLPQSAKGPRLRFVDASWSYSLSNWLRWEVASAVNILLFVSACCQWVRPTQADTSCHRRTETPEFAVNPLEPSLFVFNHPVFAKFSIQWYAFDPSFVVEAFGTKVDYRFDCDLDNKDISMPLYRVVTVSRHFACRQHEMRMALKTPPRCVPGFFPVVDDEYHEFVDVLLSVVEYAEYAAARPYVMVELGARYGTWAVRSVKALQQLNPAANFIAVVVEGDYRSQQAARRHCAYNGVRCTFHDAFVHGEDEAPATNVTTIRAIFDEIEPEVIGANLRLPAPHCLVCSR